MGEYFEYEESNLELIDNISFLRCKLVNNDLYHEINDFEDYNLKLRCPKNTHTAVISVHVHISPHFNFFFKNRSKI